MSKLVPYENSCAVMCELPRCQRSLMSPSKVTLNLSAGISSVMVAASVSVPATAFATACSISRCELTPTMLRNLRMLRLSVSS